MIPWSIIVQAYPEAFTRALEAQATGHAPVTNWLARLIKKVRTWL